LARRLSSPPVLPYTTLFRSRDQHDGFALARRQACVQATFDTGIGNCGLPSTAASLFGGQYPGFGLKSLSGRIAWAFHQQASFGKDRKSTRLNSSHVKSSYAV